jgi:phosphohistidine phosphatase
VTSYLVRHGTAAPGPSDRARPLTADGRAEIEATARALVGHGVQIAEIRHSGLVRARESAEVLGRALAPARGVRATAGLAPDDDPDIAAAELDLAREPLMLVGHLPHLARLATAMVGETQMGRVHFAPGTAVGLRRSASGWQLDLVVPAPGGDRS